jgi:hypothetical protein
MEKPSRLSGVQARANGLAKGLARRAARRAGERIQGSPPGLRLGVVLVGWDREQYDRVRTVLERQLGRIEADAHLVAVNNNPDVVLPDSLPGSNDAHEFSGYDEGVEAYCARHGRPDAWLLVDDRAFAQREDVREILNAPTLTVAGSNDTCVAWIDRMPDHRILDHRSTFNMRSNIILLPDTFLMKLGTVAWITGDRRARFERALPENMPLGYDGFALDEVDETFCQVQHRWLTDPQGWYGSRPLSEDYWPEYRRKMMAILNEHLLTARLRQLGADFASPMRATLDGLDEMSAAGIRIPFSARLIAGAVRRVGLDRAGD